MFRIPVPINAPDIPLGESQYTTESYEMCPKDCKPYEIEMIDGKPACKHCGFWLQKVGSGNNGTPQEGTKEL